MVFSRYVTVLRGAGRLLRPTVLETKVNPERTFTETTSFFRPCNTPERTGAGIPSNTEKLSGSSIIFNDGDNFDVELKIPEFSSKAATAFGSSALEEHSATDSFGSEFFISDDVMLDNVATEPVKGPLDTCDEDLSHITPYHKPTFNFAAYANDSPMIQELAKLGVEFYKLEHSEKKMKFLLQRNFSDMKPYIRFLHDSGVPTESIGAFITKNPFIFSQSIDDLHTRIRYLRAHKFNVDMIARIISRNPHWLMFNTNRIDGRLGFFQQEFKLDGQSVRLLTTKQPRLITYSISHIKENTFAVKEEMGFDIDETRRILLAQPRLFMKSRRHIVEVFDYAHNTMKLPHDIICRKPQVLTCRLPRLQTRHRYLETLGKNQYDPKEPLYVSPEAIISGTDVDFCLNVAKTTVGTYNSFQKTL